MKGAIQPDHMPINSFELIVLGILTNSLTVTEMSGIEEELEAVDLPDRTKASGGNKKATESTFKIPMHHLVENVACEAWYLEGQHPVAPTYKKVGTLVHKSISNGTVRSYSLVGVWISKRVLPDLEMQNEGEMATVEYTISIDEILPI